METLPHTSPANSHQASLPAPLPSWLQGQDLPPQAHRGALPCRAGPSPGILSAAPRGSCPHPDKCWAPRRGLRASCCAPRAPLQRVRASRGTPAVARASCLNPGFPGRCYSQEKLKRSPQGEFIEVKPIPFRQVGSTQTSHIFPWTTRGCSWVLPERQDPRTRHLTSRTAPGLTKGKVKKEKEFKNNFFFQARLNSKVTETFPCLVRS